MWQNVPLQAVRIHTVGASSAAILSELETETWALGLRQVIAPQYSSTTGIRASSFKSH